MMHLLIRLLLMMMMMSIITSTYREESYVCARLKKMMVSLVSLGLSKAASACQQCAEVCWCLVLKCVCV